MRIVILEKITSLMMKMHPVEIRIDTQGCIDSLINSIDTKGSPLFLLIVSTNAVFKTKKRVAKIKFDRKIYHDLLTYILIRMTFPLCTETLDS